MDKLIRHRFWILIALVPPLVVFGYYSANAAIKAATTARTGQLDGVLSQIPDGNGPNETFVKKEHGGLEVLNEQLRKAVDIEMARVWAEQIPRMDWPQEMVENGFVPDEYRGEFSRDAVFTYKDDYEDQLHDLYNSLEPLRLDPSGGVSGKVRYDRMALPRHYFGMMSVPSEDIWDAQEDIWFLQLLFDAIRRTNRPAENAAKSAVRWLYTVNLMGGDGQSTVRSSGGGGAQAANFGGGNTGKGGGNFIEDDDGVGFGGGMAMAGAGGATSVAFDPSEEFGDPTKSSGGRPGAGGAAQGGGFGGGKGNYIEDDDEEYSGAAAYGRPGAGALGGENLLRYIEAKDNAKFQERGFYMSVLIDQKKIADFLVELTNSDWPIRVVRFNIGPNPMSPTRRAGGGAMFSQNGRQADTDGPGFGGGFSAAISGKFGGGGGMGGVSAGMNRMMNMMDDDEDFVAPGFSGSSALFGGNRVADDDGLGRAGGTIGAAPMLRGDQIGELFSHPDLVQMDLCGRITMYKPPTPELLASVADAAAAGNPQALEVVELMGLSVAEAEAAAQSAAEDAASAAAEGGDEQPAAEQSEPTEAPADGEAAEEPSAESATPAVDETAPDGSATGDG